MPFFHFQNLEHFVDLSCPTHQIFKLSTHTFESFTLALMLGPPIPSLHTLKINCSLPQHQGSALPRINEGMLFSLLHPQKSSFSNSPDIV